MTTKARIEDLLERRDAARAVPPRTVRRLAMLGRLTARERIRRLLDPESFVETGTLARHRSVNFASDTSRPLSDGVITGYGTINGRQVCVYAQDATMLGGSVGEVFGEKVDKIIELAVQTGCPVISINDSSGARVAEGVLSLAAYGKVARRVVTSSGVIPQISMIMGACAGGAVYTPATTDFIVMVQRTSHMFVTGPEVIRKSTGESVGLEELGGASVHSSKTGNAHYAAPSEDAAIEYVRNLLSYLPSSNREEPPCHPVAPDMSITESDLSLDTMMPDGQRQGFNMFKVIDRLIDTGSFLEIQPTFAPNLICGFARVEGRTVAVVANQPMRLAGALNIDAAEKGARFVRFCDAFNIPILTIVDVPGFLPGTAQEHLGIIRRGAKLAFAYIEATVPKVTMVVRKAYGGGYAVMGAKELGADLCFAWPTAQIGVMGAASGVDLLFHRELATAEDPQKLRAELIEQYEETLLTPYLAAEYGSIDDVIVPSESRTTVIRALRALRSKRVCLPTKKHSNIPL